MDADGGSYADAAPPPSPCETGAHAACFDFDRAPLEMGWSDLHIAPSATLTLDPSRAVTKPRSMLATTPRRTTKDIYAAGRVQVDGAWTHARIELDA